MGLVTSLFFPFPATVVRELAVATGDGTIPEAAAFLRKAFHFVPIHEAGTLGPGESD